MTDTSILNQIDSVPRTAIRHDLVAKMLSMVLQNQLPAGTRLVVQKLAQQFGVSSTPVREALVELESVGIIEFLHNRGAVIKPFGVKQYSEVCHLRRVLEEEATRCATGRISQEELEKLKKETATLIDRNDNEQWAQHEMQVDRKLHDLIAQSCGNQRLIDEISKYNNLIQTGRDIVGNRRNAQEIALSEHLVIIDALLANDPEAASQAMATHINNTAALVTAVMFPDDADSTVEKHSTDQ